MQKSPNRDFQYKAVSAGIALGMCILERYELPGAKMPLEFAFENAWRSWGHRIRFPAMDKVFDFNVPTQDPYIVLTSANERVQTPRVPYYWDDGELGGHQIYGRDGWEWDPTIQDDADFVAGLLTDDPTIPARAWKALARALFAELDAS
ncbi:hypothetical protein [Arthrobacter antibioticus]|uniref:hypothetical protein n=1 Tax=Arthrobacter sp. H35-MC1 TaxID=3046203 RepID=UPI0024B9611F|nr:hypothetical protein [Arthrobacter sp. H35-MC1]MDJ0317858.1 hypothetical protein [Arthrobacter sp. H35-MC1]